MKNTPGKYKQQGQKSEECEIQIISFKEMCTFLETGNFGTIN